MDHHEVTRRLEALRQENYPLTIEEADARALVACINAIMETVPPDDRYLVRGDYALAASALYHPSAEASGD